MKVIIKGLKDDSLGADLSLKEIFELKQKYEEIRSVVKNNNSQGKKRGKKKKIMIPEQSKYVIP